MSYKAAIEGLKDLWIQKFTVAQLLQFGLLVHAAFLLIFFVGYGTSRMVDAETIFLTLVLDGVLFAALYWSDGDSYPHVILLVWVVGVFVLPRILSYQVMSEDLLRVPFKSGFTTKNVNKALLYIILGTCVIVVGFRAASWLWSQKPSKRIIKEDRHVFSPFFPPPILSIVWMIVFGVTWYFMIWKGASVFNLEREPIPGLWLIYFFNMDTVALITIVMVLLHKTFFWEHKKFVVVLLVVYLVTTVLLGSRGGVVRIGWIIGIFMLTYAGNFRLSIRQALGFCLSVIVASVLLYPVGTQARHVRAGLLREGPGFVRVVTGAWGLGRGLNKVEEGSTKPRELSVPERDDSFAIWSWGPAKLLPHLLGKIVNRIGVLDYVVEILSDRGNRAQLKRYMNIEYAVKSFLNSTVLGTPFPEAEIKTSRVMPIVYRERNEDHLRRNFLSEPWTVWGLGYAFFGVIFVRPAKIHNREKANLDQER